MHMQEKHRRWYDKDPLLSMAMQTLKESSDEEQINLALHLIKIINEHTLEQGAEEPEVLYADREAPPSRASRWYDFDQTVKQSIESLRCCAPTMQKIIARRMAQKLDELLLVDGDEN